MAIEEEPVSSSDKTEELRKEIERLQIRYEYLLRKAEAIIVHGSGLHRNVKLGKTWDDMGNVVTVMEIREIGRKDWLPNNAGSLPKTSWDARMRLAAAAKAWQRARHMGKDIPIIAVGGNNYPSLTPTIAETMKFELVHRFGVEGAKIIVAGIGGNTVNDFHEVRKILKEKRIKAGLHISSRYHKAAAFLAEKLGVDLMTAEDILRVEVPQYRQIVEDLYRSPALRGLTEDQERRIKVLSIPGIGEIVYQLRSAGLSFGKKPGQGIPVTVFDSGGLRVMVGKPDKLPAKRNKC